MTVETHMDETNLLADDVSSLSADMNLFFVVVGHRDVRDRILSTD
jgi:hypothetical protein